VAGPERAERDQAAAHQGQRCRGVHLRGDVADQARVGEHDFGVDIPEDDAAHPVTGVEPCDIGSGRDDGADHLAAGPDRIAGPQHPDQPDADPDGFRMYEQLSWAGHRYRRVGDLGRAAGREKDLAHPALSIHHDVRRRPGRPLMAGDRAKSQLEFRGSTGFPSDYTSTMFNFNIVEVCACSPPSSSPCPTRWRTARP
jgi:hypothetical protein